MTRQDQGINQSRGFKWRMDEKLYTKSQLATTCLPSLRSNDYLIRLHQINAKVDRLLNRNLNQMIRKIPIK